MRSIYVQYVQGSQPNIPSRTTFKDIYGGQPIGPKPDDRINKNKNRVDITLNLCWCGRLGQVPQPWLASLHWLGHLPSLALLLYKKKISSMEVRRTPDEITDQAFWI